MPCHANATPFLTVGCRAGQVWQLRWFRQQIVNKLFNRKAICHRALPFKGPVRQEIVQYHGTISSLRDQVTTLVRDNGILKGIIESHGYLRRSKKPRTERTDEDVPRKT